jgi:hypothetical protein
MSFVYHFAKAVVNKQNPFEFYLYSRFSKDIAISYIDGDVTIVSPTELQQYQIDTLQTLIDNYVDPDVFLQLTATNTYPTTSDETNSTTLTPVHAFINAYNDISPPGVLNAIKMLIRCNCKSTEYFGTMEDVTSMVAIQVYDKTRNYLIANSQVEVSGIVQGWKDIAQNGDFSAQQSYVTLSIEGLRDKLTNHDCIWEIRACVSDEHIYVNLGSIQFLYYDVQT